MARRPIDQDLDRVRLCLQRAYSPDPRPSCSPLAQPVITHHAPDRRDAAAEAAARARAGLLPGQPLRQRVTFTETRAKPKPTIPLDADAFAQSRLLRAVAALPPFSRCWVLWAYSPRDLTWAAETEITRVIWQRFEPSLAGCAAATVTRCRSLAWLAALETRDQCRYGEGTYSPEHVRLLLSLSPHNWRRDWLPRWRALLAIALDCDVSALTPLLPASSGVAA